MRTQPTTKTNAALIHAVAQNALRAAVYADSERDGVDILADGLLKVCDISTRAPANARPHAAEGHCRIGGMAILSTRFGTRLVRIKARAADLCYDWKVEVLGSPIWCVDARSDMPALTNLGLVNDAQLFPLAMDDMELEAV